MPATDTREQKMGKQREQVVPATVNEIVAHGRIIAERPHPQGRGKRIFTISSITSENAYIRFTCWDDVLPNPLYMREHVVVHGHAESTKYYDRNGKPQYGQQFIADKVEIDRTLVEEKFGVPGKFYPHPSNAIYLKGTIRSAIDDNGWARLLVEVDADTKGRHMSTLRASLRKPERMPALKKDDTICIVGSIISSDKEHDGERRYFENIMVNDFAVERAKPGMAGSAEERPADGTGK